MLEINKEKKTTFAKNLFVIIIQDDVCKKFNGLNLDNPHGDRFSYEFVRER